VANPLIAVRSTAVPPALAQVRPMRCRRFKTPSPGRFGPDALPVIGPDPRTTAAGARDTLASARAVEAARPAPAREER
jgi:hypothetical protein